MSVEPNRRLWLAVLLPPAVWAAQGLFGWFVASHGCPGTSRPWSLGAARWAVALFTLVALAVSVGGLTIAARNYKEKEQPDKIHTLSMIGLLVGGVLTLGVIFAGLPSLILAHCGEMR